MAADNLELNDAMLDEVAGGKAGHTRARYANSATQGATTRDYCEYCKSEQDFQEYSGGRKVCTKCGHEKILV